MAIPFNKNVRVKRTIIAAAAFTKKPSWGRDTQLKIWMGKTVKESVGLAGTKGTYVSAPITINGAVSPIARDNANITPVKIPPKAAGRVCKEVVCHFDAPIA